MTWSDRSRKVLNANEFRTPKIREIIAQPSGAKMDHKPEFPKIVLT